MNDNCKCYKKNCPNRILKPENENTSSESKIWENPKIEKVSKEELEKKIREVQAKNDRCYFGFF